MPEERRVCPKCKNELPLTTLLAGTQEFEQGDMGVCGYCGTILILDAELKTRIAQVEDVIGLPAYIMTMLCTAQRIVLAERGARN